MSAIVFPPSNYLLASCRIVGVVGMSIQIIFVVVFIFKIGDFKEMDESTDTTNRPLTEIGTLDLCGERIKLGKNGCVKLVRESVDAWGSKYGVELDLWEWLSNGPFTNPDTITYRAQALLDELGKALYQLSQARDSKLGKGKGQEG